MAEGDRPQIEVCRGTFFTWAAFNKVIWAWAILTLGMIGSSTGYAIATSSALSKAQTQIERQAEDIKAMASTYQAIDSKLERILFLNTTKDKK